MSWQALRSTVDGVQLQQKSVLELAAAWLIALQNGETTLYHHIDTTSTNEACEL